MLGALWRKRSASELLHELTVTDQYHGLVLQELDRCGVDPRSRGSTVGQAHDLIGDAAGFPFVDVAGIADGEFGLQQRRSLTAPRGDITRIPSMRIRRCRHDARMRFATGLHIRCVALSGDYAMLASS